MSSNKTRIVVLGSLNMDVVLRCDTMPARGETVHAQSLSYIPGGKGGNQAVACARHGAQVALVGAVGRDAMVRSCATRWCWMASMSRMWPCMTAWRQVLPW